MLKILLASLFLLTSSFAQAEIKETVLVNQFIRKMTDQHQFDPAELRTLFKSVDIKQKIIKTMERPAEGVMPWYTYRKIFMQEKRIQDGVKFWQNNLKSLTTMQQLYGLPEEVIIAIIGVETFYGTRVGGHRVIDALATLGFAYPKRSKFFLSELEHFLRLCREEKMNPLEPIGSYAGAMGIPQFMPSSYRHYAADFEGDGKRDIWTNPADAIASVANYFVKHHWQAGQDIAFPVTVTSEKYKKVLTKGLKPDMTAEELAAYQIELPVGLNAQNQVKLLSFKQLKGHDLWVGLDNFYVITRYNHSALYAMAVLQLSEAIKQQYVASGR